VKWIGQHIWDFVSRFRNKVVLEDLTESTEEYTIMVKADGELVKSVHPMEKSRLQVRNDEGSTIPAGAPLYSKGEIGGSERILVGICDADDAAKMPCIGVAEAEMNTTSTKDNFAITQGVYNANISGFSSLSDGDIVYVSSSGSAPYLTQVKPTGEASKIQNVGIVLKTNGTICQGLLVSAVGRTNDTPNLDNNKIFVGNGSNQVTTKALNTISVNEASIAKSIVGPGDSDVTITSDGEVIVKLDSDNDESFQKFKIINNADAEVASITEGGELYVEGDITNYGSNNDLTFSSDGNMTFIIDRDDDETGQSFSFKNFNVEIADLDESGNLQIDGDLTVSGGNITNAVTFDSGITDSGTIAAGTWNGTAIASAYLDADTAHLTTDQTFTGAKTFDAKLTLDGDKNITPSGDGVTLHVDAQDITDTNTATSGTTGFFNHVVVENPRLLATNSSVTTTQAATFYIKGAPVASTNQTITNAYSIYVQGGDSYFGGDIIVAGNDIKDSGGNSIISSDGSGVVTMAGGNIAVGGSNANLNMNSGSDIILEADNAGGSLASSIQYNSSTGNKIMLGATSDVVVLCNRTLNGTVEIRANAAAGSGGEVTVVTVHDDKVDISQDLNVTGIITGKQREIYSQSFLDDLGTTKHYLPWKDINEQTTIYQEEAAMIMPCDGRVVSVTIRTSSITGSGNMTIGVNTIGPNVNHFSTGNWTEEETETLAIESTDDYHVFHFAFDNAKHFDSGDLVTISIQNDADLSGTTYWYVSTVVEYDWNTFLGTTSGEHDSNP